MAGMTDDQRTDGMIALIPRADDATKLVVSGGDRAEEMHLTLTYLGDDITGWDATARSLAVNAAGSAASQLAPVTATVMGHGLFNPDDAERDPCSVYLIGDSAVLGPLRNALVLYATAEQHEPFIPHVTAGYGIPVTRLDYTGPIVFDRVRVALGEQVLDFPLGDPEEIKRIMDDVETKGKMPPQFAASAAKKKAGASGDDKGGTGDAGINNIGDLAKAVKAYKAAKADAKGALWPKIKAAATKLKATKMLSGLEPPPSNGTDKKLFEVLELEFKVTSRDPRAARLREMWAHMPKLTKLWKPGVPGDFKRLVRALHEHTDIPERMIKGFAANVHHLALGQWPGREGRKEAFDWLDLTGLDDGIEAKSNVELPSGQVLFDSYKAIRSQLDDALGDEEDPEDVADGGADEATEDGPGDDGESPEDVYGQALSSGIDWTLEGDGSLDDPADQSELDSPSQLGENSPEEQDPDDEDLNEVDDIFALVNAPGRA